MKLSHFCIKRPAFTIVISLIIVVFGLLGLRALQVSWLPRVVVPVIAINTSYPGASAATIEPQVTQIIENELAGIKGIDYITSWSNNGSSTVTVYFKVGTNLDAAASDIRGAIARVTSRLPKGCQTPVINKRNPAAKPILIIAFLDKSKTIAEISNYVDNFIKPQLDTIPGVGNLTVWGEKKYAMRIWLKPKAMAAHHVTVTDIVDLLQSQNVSVASGQIRGQSRYFTVDTNLQLETPQQFARLIISDQNNQAVKLSDVADVAIGSENIDTLFHINGQPGIAIGITPSSDANPLDVTQDVLKTFNRLKQSLPHGMIAINAYNQSDFTRASIDSVYHTLFEAVLLVLIVVIVFIGNWRAASIPIITIPVCLIGGFAIMLLFGYTINLLTLLALVLSIGLVVDDAIVMLENIERKISQGMAPIKAALEGSKQIAFAIVAMTITLIAVYAPLGFATGVTGAFFREFAFTLAGTVLISGFIALTLSPMMCGHILKPNTKENNYTRWLNNHFDQLMQAYRNLLRRSAPRTLGNATVLIVAGILGYALVQALPSRLEPAMDQNAVNINAQAPEDASFAYTKQYIPEIEQALQGVPGIKAYITQMVNGPSSIYVFVVLKPKSQRKLSDIQIGAMIDTRLQKMRGLKINVSPNPAPIESYTAGTGDDPTQVQLVIKTVASYQDLYHVATNLLKQAQHFPSMEQYDHLLKWNTEQVSIAINRQLAANLAVPMQNITTTIGTMLGSNWINNYQYNGKNYKVLAQLNLNDLSKLTALDDMFVRSNNGAMIPLSALVKTHIISAPLQYLHFDRLRADAIVAKIKPGYSMGDAVSELQSLLPHLPDDYQANFAGAARAFIDAGSQMTFIFAISLIFIYLVLVAQYESFIDPFIVLLTVPFAAVGALFTLWLVGDSINFYSQVGIVTLIGLIAKNGVLITDFANELVDQGKSIQEAAVEAAALRLRPILMTALAMILGAIPLAIATGAGSEDRQTIGWVIVGGLFFGTLFSLFIVPAAYIFFAKFKKRVSDATSTTD